MPQTGTSWSSPPPTEGSADEPAPAERKQRSFFAELPLLILIAFVLALLLKTFLVQAFYIPSASMEPTLLVGDRVLVNKLVYEMREPRRGEIVVFTTGEETGAEQGNVITRFLRGLSSGLGVAPPAEKDFIKRVMGLPGETVEMKSGVVYVDGQPIPEELYSEGGYLAERDMSDFGPVTVPVGEYFMMGDNRLNSSDSRFGLGTIPADQVIGRAFVVIWPVGRVGTLPAGDYAADVAAPEDAARVAA
jgi:signal peptidase I